MRTARGILVIGAACALLPGCVAAPYGYYPYPAPPPYAPYGPAAGSQPYALPPPVPSAGGPAPRGHDAPPGYRPYEAPAFPGDGRFGQVPEDGRPGASGLPAEGRAPWDPGYGREPAPRYRPQDGSPSGRPRRNRLDDPEPDGPFGEGPFEEGRDAAPPEAEQPWGGSGPGQPGWR